MAHISRKDDPAETFRRDYVDILPEEFTELLERVKTEGLSHIDSHSLESLSQRSHEIKLAVAFHVGKYSRSDSTARKYADNVIFQFVDHCFTQDRANCDFLMEGLLAYMSDQPQAYKHYSEFVRSWQETADVLAHISGRRGSGNTGGQGGDQDGPQGFDPM